MSTEKHNADLDGSYPFLSEVAEMRRRTRRQMAAISAPTELSPNHPAILQLLNEALSTELVCVGRYLSHAQLAGGPLAESLRADFVKYAQEEQGHADQLAERIQQLGGTPQQQHLAAAAPAPAGEEIEVDVLVDLLEEDLIAERIAIESYREIAQFVGAGDPGTRKLLESILAVELGHAQELAAMRSEVLRRNRTGATSTTLPQLELQCA